MKEKISEFVYSHREEMVDIIRQLVEIPSVKESRSSPLHSELNPAAPSTKCLKYAANTAS